MIILVFPKFVGGKFISNCLALSKHCVIQDKKIAELDLQVRDTWPQDKYYNFKLSSAVRSLPNAEQMGNWLQYEYGCENLYGVNETFYQENSIADIKTYLSNLDILQKLHGVESCMITHDYRTLMKYLVSIDNTHLIEFTNYDNFRALAARLKGGDVTTDEYINADRYYKSDQEFYKLESYKINVDQAFHNWTVFDEMMRGLYDKLNFTDYRPELVNEFWKRYIALHND